MYKLWCLLVYGFVPKWKIIKEEPITKYDPKRDAEVPIGRGYILQCEQTGKLTDKFFKV